MTPADPSAVAETLGEVDGQPILLVRHSDHEPTKLIVAGFHGDEPAGPLALLRLTEKHRLPRGVALIPVVNPSGWDLGTRMNARNQDPDRGFIHTTDEPSPEAQILLRHMPRLLSYAKEGLLTLHEDVEMEGTFYLCSNGDPTFTRRIYDAVSRFFRPSSDGSLDAGHPDQGITQPTHDGSFEDCMLSHGVKPLCYVETPGKSPLEARVEATLAVCETFLGISAAERVARRFLAHRRLAGVS